MPSHWAWWQTGGAVLLLVLITLFVVRRARSAPYLIVGWLIFLGMLVPTIRLFHAGFQSIADRYTYLPSIGIFIAVVWAVADWGGRRRGAGGVAQPSGQDTPSGTPAPRAALGAAGAGVLLVCAALTIRQVSWWHDTLRLFQHALDVTGDNYMAHNNLAGYLYLRGHLDEAIAHYQASLAEEPGQTHQLEIHYYLGDALSKRGRYAEAAEQFSEVLQAQPENAAALAQLGTARARQGKLDEAARVLSEAVRIQPGDAAAHNSLGNVLAEQGKPEEAVRQFEEAARLKPDHAAAHNNLALSLSKLGRTGDAISQYREAIRLQPDFLAALNNLAWLLAAQPDARFRNGAEAVQLATRACELTSTRTQPRWRRWRRPTRRRAGSGRRCHLPSRRRERRRAGKACWRSGWRRCWRLTGRGGLTTRSEGGWVKGVKGVKGVKWVNGLPTHGKKRFQPHAGTPHTPWIVLFMDTLRPKACCQRGAILLVSCWYRVGIVLVSCWYLVGRGASPQRLSQNFEQSHPGVV